MQYPSIISMQLPWQYNMINTFSRKEGSHHSSCHSKRPAALGGGKCHSSFMSCPISHLQNCTFSATLELTSEDFREKCHSIKPHSGVSVSLPAGVPWGCQWFCWTFQKGLGTQGLSYCKKKIPVCFKTPGFISNWVRASQTLILAGGSYV